MLPSLLLTAVAFVGMVGALPNGGLPGRDFTVGLPLIPFPSLLTSTEAYKIHFQPTTSSSWSTTYGQTDSGIWTRTSSPPPSPPPHSEKTRVTPPPTFYTVLFPLPTITLILVRVSFWWEIGGVLMGVVVFF
jgi:hypothetical protein